MRNRAFHNEPIWRDPELADKHRRICEAIGWIDATGWRYLRVNDRFVAAHAAETVPFRAKPIEMFPTESTESGSDSG